MDKKGHIKKRGLKKRAQIKKNKLIIIWDFEVLSKSHMGPIWE
jgi:hypothetical protein